MGFFFFHFCIFNRLGGSISFMIGCKKKADKVSYTVRREQFGNQKL